MNSNSIIPTSYCLLVGHDIRLRAMCGSAGIMTREAPYWVLHCCCTLRYVEEQKECYELEIITEKQNINTNHYIIGIN